MSIEDEDLGEGEATPDECEAAVAECVTAENDSEAVGFGPSDDIDDSFVVTPDPMVISSVDHLPIAVDAPLALAPAFTIDNVVCIEDRRQYVEVFDEETGPHPEVSGSFLKTFVSRSSYAFDGIERERMVFEPSRVQKRFGLEFVDLGDQANNSDFRRNSTSEKMLMVRPIRKQCEHYARQVFATEEQPDPNEFGHYTMHRLCMARRSIGGAFMSLSNEAIYGCSLRSPRDRASEKKHLDDPDQKRIMDRAHETLVPAFQKESN